MNFYFWIVLKRGSLQHNSLSSLLTINGFLAFGCLWVAIINWTTKRIVDQRFKEEFEIGVVDEWEKLAASSSKGHVN
jgi:hypothetical protein